MNEFITRPAAPQDADEIVECWRGAFGDSESFVLDFMADTGILESAVVAELDGHVRSVMFAFNGLDFEGVKTSYLYALCTHPEFRSRGMGSAVVAALAQRCFAEGAEMICLAPAGPMLQEWYQRILGMEVLQCTSDVLMERQPVITARCDLIDDQEYAKLRRGLIFVTPQVITAQSVLYRHYGGVMLHIELDGKTALACAEPRGQAILVRELLCTPGDEGRIMTVISAHLWNKETLLRQRSVEGRSLLYLTKNRQPLQSLPTAVFPFTLE